MASYDSAEYTLGASPGFLACQALTNFCTLGSDEFGSNVTDQTTPSAWAATGFRLPAPMDDWPKIGPSKPVCRSWPTIVALSAPTLRTPKASGFACCSLVMMAL